MFQPVQLAMDMVCSVKLAKAVPASVQGTLVLMYLGRTGCSCAVQRIAEVTSSGRREGFKSSIYNVVPTDTNDQKGNVL